MLGSQADGIDWENLTNKELHDKFQQMMTEQVQDVLNNFEEAMEKITGLEKTFETKLDNRFNELLARLPPPAAPVAPLQQQQLRPLPNQYGRAQRVPIEPGQNSGAAATAVGASLAPATAAAGTQEDDDYVGDYEDEVDQNPNYMQPPAQPPPGDRGEGVPSFDEMMDIALVEVDFDDPTTNVRGRRALAITKPTPRGY